MNLPLSSGTVPATRRRLATRITPHASVIQRMVAAAAPSAGITTITGCCAPLWSHYWYEDGHLAHRRRVP